MKKDLFVLLGRSPFVGLVNFCEEILLLAEYKFGVLHCVEEIEILSVLIRLEIQVIEEFYKSCVELSDFNI